MTISNSENDDEDDRDSSIPVSFEHNNDNEQMNTQMVEEKDHLIEDLQQRFMALEAKSALDAKAFEAKLSLDAKAFEAKAVSDANAIVEASKRMNSVLEDSNAKHLQQLAKIDKERMASKIEADLKFKDLVDELVNMEAKVKRLSKEVNLKDSTITSLSIQFDQENAAKEIALDQAKKLHEMMSAVNHDNNRILSERTDASIKTENMYKSIVGTMTQDIEKLKTSLDSSKREINLAKNLNQEQVEQLCNEKNSLNNKHLLKIKTLEDELKGMRSNQHSSIYMSQRLHSKEVESLKEQNNSLILQSSTTIKILNDQLGNQKKLYNDMANKVIAEKESTARLFENLKDLENTNRDLQRNIEKMNLTNDASTQDREEFRRQLLAHLKTEHVIIDIYNTSSKKLALEIGQLKSALESSNREINAAKDLYQDKIKKVTKEKISLNEIHVLKIKSLEEELKRVQQLLEISSNASQKTNHSEMDSIKERHSCLISQHLHNINLLKAQTDSQAILNSDLTGKIVAEKENSSRLMINIQTLEKLNADLRQSLQKIITQDMEELRTQLLDGQKSIDRISEENNVLINELKALKKEMKSYEIQNSASSTALQENIKIMEITLEKKHMEANQHEIKIEGLKNNESKLFILFKSCACLHIAINEMAKILNLKRPTDESFLIRLPKKFMRKEITFELALREVVPEKEYLISLIQSVLNLDATNLEWKRKLSEESSNNAQMNCILTDLQSEWDRTQQQLIEKITTLQESNQSDLECHKMAFRFAEIEISKAAHEKEWLNRALSSTNAKLLEKDNTISQLEDQFIELYEKSRQSHCAYVEDLSVTGINLKMQMRENAQLKEELIKLVKKRDTHSTELKKSEKRRSDLEHSNQDLQQCHALSIQLLQDAEGRYKICVEEIENNRKYALTTRNDLALTINERELLQSKFDIALAKSNAAIETLKEELQTCNKLLNTSHQMQDQRKIENELLVKQIEAVSAIKSRNLHMIAEMKREKESLINRKLELETFNRNVTSELQICQAELQSLKSINKNQTVRRNANPSYSSSPCRELQQMVKLIVDDSEKSFHRVKQALGRNNQASPLAEFVELLDSNRNLPIKQ